MKNEEKQHKRRVRYSGTHPRNYKEKYKELNPEKYADTIEKCKKKTLCVVAQCLIYREKQGFVHYMPSFADS